LLYALACAGAFAAGYILLYRKKRRPTINPYIAVDLKPYRFELKLFYVMGMLQILTNLVLVIISRLDYVTIVIIKYEYSFLFQSRMIFLILLAHFLLNVPPKQLWTRRDLRSVRWTTLTYTVLTILLQFRSEVFEIAAIVAFSLLMWTGDKVKVKYILLVVCSIIVPNLIVLGRMGFPSDLELLMKGLFSFEYSTLFNNILSDAVLRGREIQGGLTFLPELILLIPSPLRALFGVYVPPSDYQSILTSETGVIGGGFSFLGEMYSNFGWFAPMVFGMLGMLIGRINARAARIGRVTLFYAVAPLLYVDFIVAFRNDFGIFIKTTIQLFIVAILIDILRRLRLVGHSRKLSDGTV
jgi:hypothetical protein